MREVEVGVVVGKVSAFEMDALDSRIRELVAYARERDGEDRTTLFRSLVDMFLTGKAPAKEPTRSQLLDVLEALIPHVEAESRRTVSEILAGMAKPPIDLVHRLIRDRAGLVEDLLKNTPLDEDEIIDLISQTGREHHQILATRNDLSANVWIALARAAPSAPPFEGRSTLALWRDDLGTQAACETATEVLEEFDSSSIELEEILEPKRVAVAGGSSMTVGGSEAGFSTNVTRLRPETGGDAPDQSERKPASLRILRTDEDLIAERISKAPPPETKMIGHSEDAPTNGPLGLTEPKQNLTETTASKFLRDPGPGGWAWRSDRDGFITLVSPFAAKIFGGLDNLVGTAMLDMLGLNKKLDHPVSRALQRRSTIHDAPINLQQLNSQHQFWTLEAAPVFSTGGGVFEGFEGILTPVVPASSEAEQANPDYDLPLFLDDEEAVEPEPSTERKTLKTANQAATTADDDPAEMVGAQTKKAAADSKEPKTESGADNAIADMINSTAAAMVRNVVADVLKPLSPKEEENHFGETQKAPPPPTAKQPQKTNFEGEIEATLNLLEEALARLAEASESGAVAQIRLQSEIASACARTLKELLKDK